MLWKIYCCVLLVLVAGGPAVVLSTDPTVFDWLDLLASAALLTGLFAFAFGKRILTRSVWKSAFVALVGWSVLYNFLLARVLELAQRGIPASFGAMVFGVALVVPAYVGLFLYAYRSDEIWPAT